MWYPVKTALEIRKRDTCKWILLIPSYLCNEEMTHSKCHLLDISEYRTQPKHMEDYSWKKLLTGIWSSCLPFCLEQVLLDHHKILLWGKTIHRKHVKKMPLVSWSLSFRTLASVFKHSTVPSRGRDPCFSAESSASHADCSKFSLWNPPVKGPQKILESYCQSEQETLNLMDQGSDWIRESVMSSWMQVSNSYKHFIPE